MLKSLTATMLNARRDRIRERSAPRPSAWHFGDRGPAAIFRAGLDMDIERHVAA
jgi:hypothetical protein